MVSSVFSQAMAILPKGILAYDEHLPEMEFPRRIRFVGVWSQKEIICELSKKKVKVDYVILFFKFKKIWLSFQSWVLSSGTPYKYREYLHTLLIFSEHIGNHLWKWVIETLLFWVGFFFHRGFPIELSKSICILDHGSQIVWQIIWFYFYFRRKNKMWIDTAFKKLIW